MAREITIGGIALGNCHAPSFWPDIDLYFKRDLNIARDLVDRLAAAGCRFLKAAVLHDADICLSDAHPVTFFDAALGRTRVEPYQEVIRRHALPLPALAELLDRARASGLAPVLSVYDAEGLDFAIGEGAQAIKIPSSNITHQPLIEAAAAAGLPLVVDTGRARWAEIERAVSWAREAGSEGGLLLQHSPPGPPAGAARFHMRMIEEMREHFDCPVGLSDHGGHLAMFPIACALGAALIEKGVVAEGAAPDIDLAHALPIGQVAEALELIERSWLALGLARRPDAEAGEDPARMGLVAARDVSAGDALTLGSVCFRFPTVGIGAERWGEVRGQRLRRAVAKGVPITPGDLEPSND